MIFWYSFSVYLIFAGMAEHRFDLSGSVIDSWPTVPYVGYENTGFGNHYIYT